MSFGGFGYFPDFDDRATAVGNIGAAEQNRTGSGRKRLRLPDFARCLASTGALIAQKRQPAICWLPLNCKNSKALFLAATADYCQATHEQREAAKR
jgi:hypothetical protein